MKGMEFQRTEAGLIEMVTSSEMVPGTCQVQRTDDRWRWMEEVQRASDHRIGESGGPKERGQECTEEKAGRTEGGREGASSWGKCAPSPRCGWPLHLP